MSSYLHGTSKKEQQRLTTLNHLLNEEALRVIRLQQGDRVLDVGCGLGQFSRQMAKQVGPGGKVLCIERSIEQISEGLRQARVEGEESLIELRQGSALSLPLRQNEWGTFDVAHTRFLLEHVNDPLAVVRMMLESVRQGGRVVLQDDDHDLLRLCPPVSAFGIVWQAYMRVFEQIGNDPYIGRRLVTILHDAGANPVQNTWLFFGGCQGHSHFDLYVDNLKSVVVGSKEAILHTGMVGDSEFTQCMQQLEVWRRLPDATIWYGVCYAEAIRR